jgi:hypothetical protein
VKPVPFGAVYPQAWQQHHPDVHAATQTQCIIQGTDDAEVEITVRFLHLRGKRLVKINPEKFGRDQFQPTDTIKAGDKTYYSGWEAEERKINVGRHKIKDLIDGSIENSIHFEEEQMSDILFKNEKVAGNMIIRQSAINGNVRVSAKPVGIHEEGYQITIKIANTTPVDNPKQCSRDEIYFRSFLSANTILQAEKGKFISKTDPPQAWQEVNEACKNVNTWPVLIDKDDKTMLSSPIVLYDYPEIAPESRGDMFDSTEIEEMLMLQVAALTDEEKKEVEQTDGKMKAMLERVRNTTPEELLKLHGGFKDIETRMNESSKNSQK